MEVVNTHEKHGVVTQLLNLSAGITPNQFLQNLLQEPIEIVSFQEKLPSMEDIFISAVQQRNINN
jgi:ABC-2 type transport system ATP-binding protein